MTRFLSLGVLVMVLVLNAWPVGAASQRAQAPVTIRVSTWDTGNAGLKPYQVGIKAFEAANPGIKVDVESISNPMSPGLSFYLARVLAEIAAGNAPDVILVPDDNARTFAHSGQLLDLGPVLKKGGVKLSDFYTNVWNIGNLSGTTYYVPKDWADLSVFYNKTMFQKAGLPFPKAGWTWADFLRDARALTIVKNGHPVQWGANVGNGGLWLRAGLEYFVGAAGGHILNPAGTSTTGYLTSPVTEKAIEYFLNLYTRYHISPTPAIVSGFGTLDLFNAQKVAMSFWGPWPLVGVYEANPKLRFGVAPMPIGPSGRPVTEPFWAGYGIYKGSKHLSAAEKFIVWSASRQWATIDATWSMPAFKDVAVTVSMKRDPHLAVFFQQAPNVIPEEETKTFNFDDDVAAPLQHMIDVATSGGSSVNVPTLIAQTSAQINAKLAATYKHQ
jgi:multiple sugar transport system substrate-binding protein